MSKKRDKIKIAEGRLALVFVILIVVAFYGFRMVFTQSHYVFSIVDGCE